MFRLRNPIRRYAWGSHSVIAGLQGRPVPSPYPEAELWIGAHPADPSTVEPDGRPLTEVIAADPAGVLGDGVVARFGARLPYLLKLLAAGAPLSLQAHPDPARAAAGYAAEEAAGVPRDAPHRRYVDPYHKPELLVAVSGPAPAPPDGPAPASPPEGPPSTDLPDEAPSGDRGPVPGRFRALCGFREPAASAELLAGLGIAALAPVVAALRDDDLAAAVRWLLTHPEPAELVKAVTTGGPMLARELAGPYPDDVGVVVALLLNEVTLAPGEAIFMPAGNLHAYLSGTGVEVMAASDNVLRGGLTPKYVDVPELLRVLRFEPLADPVRRPVPVGPGVVTWPVPVPEFALHRVRLGGEVGRVVLDLPGPRTALCLAGTVEVVDGVGSVTLRAGEAGLTRAGGSLVLTGEGEVFVASTR